MKSMKKLMMLLLSLCLVLSMSMSAFAAESGDGKNVISSARDGILQVNTYYQPKDKTKGAIPLFGGTSFLVNEKMVVTCWHNLHFDYNDESTAKLAEVLEEATGEPFASNPNALTGNFYYEIVVKRDVVIRASILQESREMDFAIMELDSQIYDRKALPLDNTGSAKETDDVFALGFSAAPIRNMDVQYYTSENVVVTNGIVSMIGDVNTVPRIQHSAKISEGNSGGPLLNANGVVIGVNALGVNDDYFYATQIGEVISIMDSMGYAYTSTESAPAPQTESESVSESGETESETTLAPTPEPDKSGLQSAVDVAKEVEIEKYSEESAEAFSQALANAESVLSDNGATAEDISAAKEDLNAANLALVEEKGSNMMLFLIIGAVVIVVIIIIIVVVVASGNKKKKSVPSGKGYSAPPAGGSVPPTGYSSKPAGFTPPPASAPSPASSGSYGETSVLDAGAGETTVLSSGPVSNGYLIRKKTGEKIMLKKSVFVIGKERSKVDYCISDNTSISRVHAKFLAKGDGCYVEDQGSTNFTFVNGTKLAPQKEARLKDRDTVKLSDELFEYHKG